MLSSAQISEFFNSPWGLSWLMLSIALGYGWYRLKKSLPVPFSSARSSGQGNAFAGRTCQRTIALAFYASGALMVLFAIPFLVIPMGHEHVESHVWSMEIIVLLLVGVANLTAGILLVRAVRNRRDIATPAA